MKTPMLPVLALAVLGPGASFTATADEGRVESGPAASAMQIHVDAKTGRKTLPDDSPPAAVPAPVQRSTRIAPRPDDLAAVAAAVGMPLEREAPQRGANGALSVKLGLRDMRYAVLTIGDGGRKTITHATLAEAASGKPATDAGEK